MDRALVYVSTQTNPYANLATERLLMDAVLPGQQILYLWQNSNTIVIGRNQDAWRECLVDEFEAGGGRLARRLSGGGAVFHDNGNLNFTFIAPKETYDFASNMAIICKAVQSFGLEAKLSGRNDIEIEGAKFSGNAFFSTKHARYHHGTLMVAVDTQKLARYLKPDPRKLQQRGVASVQARVVNLQSLDARVTIASLGSALLDEFLRHYGDESSAQGAKEQGTANISENDLSSLHQASSHVLVDFIRSAHHDELQQHYTSEEWRLGTKQKYNQRFDERFIWGGIDIQLTVQEGRIKQAHLYSDSLNADFIDDLALALQGIAYEPEALSSCFRTLAQTNGSYQDMLEDIHKMILGSAATS